MHRDGAQHKQVSPANVFPCRDGYVYLFVSAGGGHWKKFLSLWSEHPPSFDASEWDSPGFRRQNTTVINDAVRQFTLRFPRDEFVEHMQSNGIPCLPVNTPREFLEDPQIRARGFVQEVTDSMGRSYRQTGTPFLLDGQRSPIRPAPAVGEHTPEFLNLQEMLPGGTASLGVGRVTRGKDTRRTDSCGALDGLRVLAFTQALAGPWAGMLLGSHGAEVIKVESSLAPDAFRRFGARQAPPRFLEYNRNTLSISVNLKHARGPDLIKRLVRSCDIVIENFSAPTMAKLGLDYPDLRAAKPDIIMLRMPGFGTSGPKRDWQSWGQTLNAYAGLLHLWRHDEQSEPAGSQTPLADYMGGVIGLCAVIAALFDRDSTGEGRLIDLSQAEALGYFAGVTYLQTLFAATGGSPPAQAHGFEKDPLPLGNRSPSAAPHDVFPCRSHVEDDRRIQGREDCRRHSLNERWCAIAVETQEQWQALCRVMEQPELAADRRFTTLDARQRHRQELNQEIARWTGVRDSFEVMRLLQAAGVPCGVVQTGEDLLRDPHLRARDFLVELNHPAVGRLVYPGSPFRLLGTPGKPGRLAPELGAHNEYVFGKLMGMSMTEIDELREEGVLI
jgi:crotonobetainyl-CoA:carnitine CoA-transferase CaiB-like acyl-CoA transferase